MRLLIDLQGAQSESRYRGIGRYTLSIVEGILANRGNHEVILLVNGNLQAGLSYLCTKFFNLGNRVTFCEWQAPGKLAANDPAHSVRRKVAEMMRSAVINSLQPDVVYIPSLFEGFLDDAVVTIDNSNATYYSAVTLYDLIPLLNAKEYLDGNYLFQEFYHKRLSELSHADCLLAISESAALEAQVNLQWDRERVFNVSTACEDYFCQVEMSDSEIREINARFKINKPYILYAGAADKRKNLDRLIKSFSLLPSEIRQSHQLVLAGRMSSQEIIDLEASRDQYDIDVDSLLIPGYVSDKDLRSLYNMCKVFILPSVHEGFGLPALEAMKCGAAVIGSNTTSIPEIIRTPEALFTPTDDQSLRSTLLKALSDGSFRNHLIESGRQHAKKFSWKQTSMRAIEIFEQLASKPRSVNYPCDTWEKICKSRLEVQEKLLQDISDFLRQERVNSEDYTFEIAHAIEFNQQQVGSAYAAITSLPAMLKWRLEGPFDSSYSLAILNRELATALDELGHEVAIHSTDGPGDYPPNQEFLQSNPDICRLARHSEMLSQQNADISSRNIYPPRVADMASRVNLLHCYGWEESGYPFSWVQDFNNKLHGLSVMSSYVEKVLIDNGVSVPLANVGIGISHWTKTVADPNFRINAKSYRFLHVSSCFPRKGADLLLQAYGKAFRASDNVSLIIKTFPNPHNEIHTWLNNAKQSCSDYPDVIILEDELDQSQLKGLFQQCQALVAPSRGEGFGLPIAEAMLSGLEVIATGWGGQSDFCNNETAWLIDYDFQYADTHFGLHESVWANPRVDHLAELMLQVYHLPQQQVGERARKGSNRLLQEFSWRDVAQRVADSGREFCRQGAIPNPVRVGWISTWNSRCGIASYSEHLVEAMSLPVTVFAPTNAEITAHDETNVQRCWQISEEEDMTNTSELIDKFAITTIVIQFNYGLFNLEYLSKFIIRQQTRGRQIILTLHSTIDPSHHPEKKLTLLLDAMRHCERVLVHTPNDMNRLKQLGLVHNVSLFPHGVVDYAEGLVPVKNSLAATSQYSRLTPKTIASYGFFLPNKGLPELIHAVNILSKSYYNIRLRMLNAEYPAPVSATLITDMKRMIWRLGLAKRIDIITNYLSDATCLHLLSEVDLIVLPYQNSQESSSAAVRTAISSGVPVAVTPIPIFSDVRKAVFSMPGTSPQAMAGGIKQILKEIATCSSTYQTIQLNAESWREQHSFSSLGERMCGMIKALARNR
jgi:glycosyltransferase involved in cell wall biosynthesis